MSQEQIKAIRGGMLGHQPHYLAAAFACLLGLAAASAVWGQAPEAAPQDKSSAGPDGARRPWQEPVAEHLAFRGYECSFTTNEAFPNGYLTCLHDLLLNVIASKGTVGTTVSGYFNGSGLPATGDGTLLANTLNSESNLVKFYWDDEGDFVLSAAFVGEYERARFSSFMDLWDVDQRLVYRDEHLAELQRLTTRQ